MTRAEIIQKYGEFFIESASQSPDTRIYIVTSDATVDGEYLPFISIVEMPFWKTGSFRMRLKRDGHYNINIRLFDEEDFKESLDSISQYEYIM